MLVWGFPLTNSKIYCCTRQSRALSLHPSADVARSHVPAAPGELSGSGGCIYPSVSFVLSLPPVFPSVLLDRACLRWRCPSQRHPSQGRPILPVALAGAPQGCTTKPLMQLHGRGKGCGAFSLGWFQVLGGDQNVAEGCKGSALDRAGKSVVLRIPGDDTMKTTCEEGKTKACGSLQLSLCPAGLATTPSFTFKTMKKRP